MKKYVTYNFYLSKICLIFIIIVDFFTQKYFLSNVIQNRLHMEINVISKPSAEIIVIKGRLDVTTTQDLEKTFTDLFAQGKNKMLIDCTELDYISSAGLRTLLTAAKNSKKVNGKIVLTNLNANVKQIFEISGFTSIFDIFDSMANAIASLEQ